MIHRKSDAHVRFGLVVLRAMRQDAGLSQMEMAARVGVSLNTVIRWESGQSSPDMVEAWEWYKSTGLSPVPYIVEWQDPLHRDTPLKRRMLVERALGLMPTEDLVLWAYILSGQHGSSQRGLAAFLAAHVHLPLKARLTHANTVALHYEVAKEIGTLRNPDFPLPDLELLKKCINLGFEAVKNGQESYKFED